MDSFINAYRIKAEQLGNAELLRKCLFFRVTAGLNKQRLAGFHRIARRLQTESAPLFKNNVRYNTLAKATK
ncbi:MULTISPECIES: hypothetical protein [unclassified Halomonas]|uniref:hypothetical protein n=1 Tax=unclassified Halomonas TaxID=2609666 RepID=UPI000F65F7F9|nr:MULTISPECIES: hypothetical protein [unclassified Halomonas]MBT2788197.1 hypothetical protein [Halomonas sp. ISL-106]MBT2795946.1 hypothetical protein [Halomonas sp. ISL-104]